MNIDDRAEAERLLFEKVCTIPDHICWQGEYWPRNKLECTDKIWDECAHLDSKLAGWIEHAEYLRSL